MIKSMKSIKKLQGKINQYEQKHDLDRAKELACRYRRLKRDKGHDVPSSEEKRGFAIMTNYYRMGAKLRRLNAGSNSQSEGPRRDSNIGSTSSANAISDLHNEQSQDEGHVDNNMTFNESDLNVEGVNESEG